MTLSDPSIAVFRSNYTPWIYSALFTDSLIFAILFLDLCLQDQVRANKTLANRLSGQKVLFFFTMSILFLRALLVSHDSKICADECFSETP